jgi:hypothetical protein
VSPVAWLAIGFIAATWIYTMIRFWNDGNLEKDALAVFLGGTLVGLVILYFFHPPFQAFVRNLWYLLFYKPKIL